MNRLLLSIIIISFSAPSYAYLDPGTGSMLLSAIVGLIATALFSVKSLYYKAIEFFYRLTGRKLERNESKLYFYSEGGQYWNTFKPVLQALDKKQVSAIYLTSDMDDQGLKFESETVKTKFIGTGNKAYSYLNMLEADVCAMTTPGLDVLQIRRSKGVKHYAHLVHACTDMGTYKLFSFDYYDSILCSGEHQKKSIRALEQLRGTTTKLLLDSGCPYMDVLADRLEKEKDNEPTQSNNDSIDSDLVSSQQNLEPNETLDTNIQTVLLAPTWGKNGLLTRFGNKIIDAILISGKNLIIRPHPQSYISEKELMQDLESKYSQDTRVSWDKSSDNFESLFKSDVLVSDLSGVVFDYAFIFEKPVITVEFEYEWKGMEANDLPFKMWELEVLDQIGQTINQNQIEEIPAIINALLEQNTITQQLRDLRDQSLYNYKNTGEVIANQLIELLEQTQKSN